MAPRHPPINGLLSAQPRAVADVPDVQAYAQSDPKGYMGWLQARADEDRATETDQSRQRMLSEMGTGPHGPGGDGAMQSYYEQLRANAGSKMNSQWDPFFQALKETGTDKLRFVGSAVHGLASQGNSIAMDPNSPFNTNPYIPGNPSKDEQEMQRRWPGIRK